MFSVVTQRPDPVCPSCKGGEQDLQIFPICHSNSDTGTDNGKEAAVCSGSELVTHSSYNTWRRPAVSRTFKHVPRMHKCEQEPTFHLPDSVEMCCIILYLWKWSFCTMCCCWNKCTFFSTSLRLQIWEGSTATVKMFRPDCTKLSHAQEEVI